MFGKIKFDLPKLDPAFVEAVRAAMVEVEAKFPGRDGPAKRAFVREQVKEAAKKIDLKGMPSWLEEPVRDAVIYVVIETIWTLLFRKPAEQKQG